jgi:hypothetical protein
MNATINHDSDLVPRQAKWHLSASRLAFFGLI